MKSMIAAFALLALVAVNAQEQVCFQAPESCNEVREQAKGYIRGALARPAGDHIPDVPKALEHLQQLFAKAAELNCKVDSCKCNAGKLECAHVTDKIRAALATAETPACIAESDKLSTRYEDLKQVIRGGDGAEFAAKIGELRGDLLRAIDAKDISTIQCLKQAAGGLKGAIQERLKDLKIEKTCDFCQAA